MGYTSGVVIKLAGRFRAWLVRVLS